MGGQACVFYGAAEFSRDLDLMVLVHAKNMALLRSALDALGAEPIAVPPFAEEYLLRGHALHFRCRREDVAGLRIDLMSNLRGVGNFEDVWARRTSIETDGVVVEMLALEDLVRAKKTQRDKDWPMIRRLVEESYFRGSGRRGVLAARTAQSGSFWSRLPELTTSLRARSQRTARLSRQRSGARGKRSPPR